MGEYGVNYALQTYKICTRGYLRKHYSLCSLIHAIRSKEIEHELHERQEKTSNVIGHAFNGDISVSKNFPGFLLKDVKLLIF
jgi:hypothetical protein